MPNGSLDMWLHPHEVEEIRRPSRTLTLLERLSIAIDVASVLDYLHVHCYEAIAHCDLKPSNVLLDDDLTAHVSDFGLASDPPQIRPGLLPQPTQLGWSQRNHRLCRTRIGFPIAECLKMVLEVGLRCCEESPMNRLAMSEALKELISIKERFYRAQGSVFSAPSLLPVRLTRSLSSTSRLSHLPICSLFFVLCLSSPVDGYPVAPPPSSANFDDILLGLIAEIITARILCLWGHGDGISFVRPLPPKDLNGNGSVFKEGSVVDAYYKDGWWTGVVVKRKEENDTYLVYLDFSLRDIIQFERKQEFINSVFSPGTMVELRELVSDWCPAMIIKELENEKSFIVKYCEHNEESRIKTVDSSKVRPRQPHSSVGEYELLDHVEAFNGSVWRRDVVRGILTPEGRYMVSFGATKSASQLSYSALRPPMVWKDGIWQKISKPKSGKESPSGGGRYYTRKRKRGEVEHNSDLNDTVLSSDRTPIVVKNSPANVEDTTMVPFAKKSPIWKTIESIRCKAVGISSRRLITSSPSYGCDGSKPISYHGIVVADRRKSESGEPSHRNRTTSPTADDREVRDSVPPDPGESLGYRKCSSVLENRNNMLKRIELPAFAGTDPYLWISQAERFFRLGKYNDEDRLDLLSITLQGPALHWFNREMQREPFQ
ncbi:unnamed protein product [Microthlaspi erraticum]|uniref:Protein kinase domain-containing protein n=1 Tax=Microthlaspi erraticum TaxID=1685480 RepID=A0A6D2HJH3_9BRAS|nr:unnamed protein product [Microthlaspi erraticum]